MILLNRFVEGMDLGIYIAGAFFGVFMISMALSVIAISFTKIMVKIIGR